MNRKLCGCLAWVFFLVTCHKLPATTDASNYRINVLMLHVSFLCYLLFKWFDIPDYSILVLSCQQTFSKKCLVKVLLTSKRKNPLSSSIGLGIKGQAHCRQTVRVPQQRTKQSPAEEQQSAVQRSALSGHMANCDRLTCNTAWQCQHRGWRTNKQPQL